MINFFLFLFNFSFVFWLHSPQGRDGASWDFQTCSYLVEAIGSNGYFLIYINFKIYFLPIRKFLGITDMFLPREWSLQWLNNHCERRFKVTPQV